MKVEKTMDTIYLEEILEQKLKDIPSTLKVGNLIKETEIKEWLFSPQEVIIEALIYSITDQALIRIIKAKQKGIIEDLHYLKKI